jgi:transcriptional regulator with XRE-family HTH domain
MCNNRCRDRRKQAGVKPERAAAELGVSITTLLKWERGDTKPNSDNVRDMARLYDVSSDALLGLK